MLCVQVLGPLGADIGGTPVHLGSPRQRAVLALLMAHRGTVVPVDRLIDRLWCGRPPEKAAASLHAYVSNLRRALEPDRAPRTPAGVLVSAPPGYALRLPQEAVDAWRFEQAVRRARTLAPAEARRLLEEALGWWRGAAYGEWADEEWAAAEAARLGELHTVARELSVEATLRSGAATEAVPSAEALVREHPLREEGWRLLALALWASGRRADALAELRRATALLAEELGLGPGEALAELQTAMLTGRTDVLRAAVPGARPAEAALSAVSAVSAVSAASAVSVVSVGPSAQEGGALAPSAVPAESSSRPVGSPAPSAGLVESSSEAVVLGGPSARVGVPSARPGVTSEGAGVLSGEPAGAAGAAGTAAGTLPVTVPFQRSHGPAAHPQPLPHARTHPQTRAHPHAGLPWEPGQAPPQTLTPAPAPAPAPASTSTSTPASASVREPSGASVPAGAETAAPFASPEPFVGRDSELRALDEAARGARRHGGVVLVTGEAGGGKSALLGRFQQRLRAADWTVVVGRCPEFDGAPPAWAWTEALGELARRTPPVDPDSLGALLHEGEYGGHADQGRHVNGRTAQGELGDSGFDDGWAVGRFRMHRAFSAWLRAAAGESPLAVVIDDLHRADGETLALLERTAELTGVPVLVIAAYRPAEAGDRLAETLAELAHRSPHRLALGGLPPHAVDTVVRAVCGTPVDADTVTALAERTGGNPFYVRESARLLASEGALVAISEVPQGVRDVLRRRLRQLLPGALAVLQLASVVGCESEVSVLIEAADPQRLPEHEVFDSLEECVLAGLLTEPAPGLVRFAHALVRDTVYTDLVGVRRARLHARVADVVRRRRPDDLAALAHHFARSATAETASLAVEYSLGAADLAERRYAHDTAAELLEQAIESFALIPADDEITGDARAARLVALLGRLLRAEIRAGAVVSARSTRQRAIEAASDVGHDALVSVALGASIGPGLALSGPRGLVDPAALDHFADRLAVRAAADPVVLALAARTALEETTGPDDQRHSDEQPGPYERRHDDHCHDDPRHDDPRHDDPRHGDRRHGDQRHGDQRHDGDGKDVEGGEYGRGGRHPGAASGSGGGRGDGVDRAATCPVGERAAAHRLAVARAIGDPLLISCALTAASALAPEGSPDHRALLASELRVLGYAHDLPANTWVREHISGMAAGALNDVAGVRRHAREGRAVARRHRLVEAEVVNLSTQAMLAHIEGRFADAEAGYADVRDRLRANRSAHGDLVYALGVTTVRLSQGRPEEAEPLLRSVQDRAAPVTWLALGVVLARQGRLDEAHALALSPTAPVPDHLYSVALSFRAELACLLLDRGAARELIPLLLPVRGQLAGAASISFVTRPLAQSLGEVHALLGDESAAQREFRRAEEVALRWGSPHLAAAARAALEGRATLGRRAALAEQDDLAGQGAPEAPDGKGAPAAAGDAGGPDHEHLGRHCLR
ncbi:BTAD domain-containing putative transcriptional regulator [Streptomyces sp. NPDC007084]|uniref:BTAD domain-containing putative transcriptional regulator n=1 Tax=Streptomyces sp. NPDC007084 TaxID=3154313 RepID=UPI003455F65F